MEALKAAGHSPAKAAEICLDAKRGDAYALQWIKAAHNLAPPAPLTTCIEHAYGTTTRLSFQIKVF